MNPTVREMGERHPSDFVAARITFDIGTTMDGYRLLTREQYALIYGLTAVALTIALLGTGIGFWSFGGLFWWPALVLAVLVVALEAHGVYLRRSE